MKTLRSSLLCLTLFLISFTGVSVRANEWLTDSLGDGYMMRYVTLPDNKKGEPQRCTVVRKLSSCSGGRAVLYVHGYNDYFFQKEEGDVWVDSCFNFYAVDLQGYGRSILPGQKKFDCRSVKEYFADIDSALNIIRAGGDSIIVMMGHSTGGLITSDFLSYNHPEDVKALILNSPFLDWNLSAFNRKIAIPFVTLIGGILPNISISQGDKSIYSESLRADMHGRWTYNHAWKVSKPEKVKSGWIRAITLAQRQVRKGLIDIPVLLMHSDKSVYGDTWNENFQRGDAVLNVERMCKYGKMLGPDVTEITIPDALHDIFLSSQAVINDANHKMFKWLDKTLDI